MWSSALAREVRPKGEILQQTGQQDKVTVEGTTWPVRTLKQPLLLGADHCHSTYITVVKSTTPVYSVHATHTCTKVYIRVPYSEVVGGLLHSPRGIASYVATLC